ncbi:MAG: hypothetical protein V4687_18020 [Bacteroidota bacterium]
MYKLLLALGIILFLKPDKSLAQSTIPVIDTLTVDQSAFTMVPDTNVQKALVKSLTGFLNEKDQGTQNNSYINPKYAKKNIEPFPFLHDIEMNGGVPFYFPSLLRAIPLEDGSFLMKIAYMGVGGDNKPYLRIIASLIAKQAADRFYFYNVLDHYTQNWNKKQVGSISYTYSSKLDIKKAEAMNQFNLNFARKLQTPVLTVNYYKFEDPEQMYKAIGFDFHENMYASRVGGLAQYWTNTVYAGNNSEQYDHEVAHFYTYIAFPKGTKNVHEGYATFAGGSGGKSLSELVPLAKKYIDAHPDKDITVLATDFYPYTPDVQLTYVLSAIVCRDIEKRFGMAGTKKLFNPAEGDDYFANLKKITGIDKNAFPAYIKQLLKINK